MVLTPFPTGRSVAARGLVTLQLWPMMGAMRVCKLKTIASARSRSEAYRQTWEDVSYGDTRWTGDVVQGAQPPPAIGHSQIIV